MDNKNIVFSNFYNGTLFIYGDFLHETYSIKTDSDGRINYEVNFNKFTKKTFNQINDPEKYDGIIFSQYIKKLYKDLDNSEQISDIINYEGRDDIAKPVNLNKIKIRGSSLNEDYSLLTFYNNTAKIYVKNLAFESSLQGKNNVINVKDALNTDLPNAEKFLFHYPLNDEKGLIPIIGEHFIEYCNQIKKEPYFIDLAEYVNQITDGINYVKNILTSNSFIIQNDTFVYVNIDGNVTTILKSQLDELNKLPGLTGELIEFEDFNEIMDRLNIKTSIIGELQSFNPTEYGSLLEFEENEINANISQFNDAFIIMDRIISSIPKLKYTDYVLSNGKFSDGLFSDYSNAYTNNVKNYMTEISGALSSSTFSKFLVLRPDIVYSENQYDSTIVDNVKVYADFLKNYKLETFLNSINIALSGYIITHNKILSNDESLLKSNLTLIPDGHLVDYVNVKPIANSSDDYINSNNADKSVDSIYLTYDNLKKYYGRLKLQSNSITNILLKLMFESKEWTDIPQKYSATEANSSYMLNSKYDTTLVFWTKFNSTVDRDRTAFFSILSDSGEFKFSFKLGSITTISKANSSDNYYEDYGQIDSRTLNQINDNYAWVMWSVKFDNSSKYYKSAPGYAKKLGISINAYTFEKDGDSFKIITHDIKDFNADMPSGNYIWEPFTSKNQNATIEESEIYENQFMNNIIYFGYSLEDGINRQSEFLYDGYIRNILLFKGHLTKNEERALAKAGIINEYSFLDIYTSDYMKMLVNSNKFFLGQVGIYDTSNINIINCTNKYNGNTYLIE